MPTKKTTSTSTAKVVSTSLDITVYETMTRCAELNGYTKIADFVKDAVLDKCMNTAAAMTSICRDHYSMKAE